MKNENNNNKDRENKDREKLVANSLLKTKAVRLNVKEPFIFVSGIKSPIYCDNRRVIGFPNERKIIVDEFINILKDKDFDIVAGTATAAIPWASFIAYELKKPLCYIRTEKKDHGIAKLIEGADCNGKNIVIIEDLISTGASSIKALKAAREEGAICVEIVSIFSYEFKKAYKNFDNANIKWYSLSNFTSLINLAKEEKYLTDIESLTALEWSKNPESWGD